MRFQLIAFRYVQNVNGFYRYQTVFSSNHTSIDCGVQQESAKDYVIRNLNKSVPNTESNKYRVVFLSHSMRLFS